MTYAKIACQFKQTAPEGTEEWRCFNRAAQWFDDARMMGSYHRQYASLRNKAKKEYNRGLLLRGKRQQQERKQNV